MSFIIWMKSGRKRGVAAQKGTKFNETNGLQTGLKWQWPLKGMAFQEEFHRIARYETALPRNNRKLLNRLAPGH